MNGLAGVNGVDQIIAKMRKALLHATSEFNRYALYQSGPAIIARNLRNMEMCMIAAWPDLLIDDDTLRNWSA